MSTHLNHIKRVREAFDLNKLAEICMAEEGFFEKYGSAFYKEGGKGKFAFYFKDNEADILAIAHMDSVQSKKDFGVAKYISGREVVLSPTLDDRLGVYVICELLPKLGLKTDILLTTDEESGNSTAKLFQTDKKYKWMFQFDRAGTDVVMYQYENKEALDKLKGVGFLTATGSASDISKLDDLGCLGFNFGIGYQDYHFERAHADLMDVVEQVGRFLEFHKVYCREHMAYDKSKRPTSMIHRYSGGEVWTPMGDWSNDYESSFGRRLNGIWHPKTIWSERLKMHVVNQRLYQIAPDTQPVTDQELIRANKKWNNAQQKDILTGGNTEAEVLLRGREELALVELEAADPKGKPFGSDDAIGYPDLDEPCICGHSNFVHRRHAVVQQQPVINACDFWKCHCKGFISANYRRRTISTLGRN